MASDTWDASEHAVDAADVARAVDRFPVLGQPHRRERLEDAVRSLPPAGRDRWAARVVQNDGDVLGWRVLRRLIRDGTCAKPDGLDYVRSMVRNTPAWELAEPGDSATYRGLLEDPDLLEEDIWRIFELEEKVLSGYLGWDAALLRLAAEGRISRDRLIDASLGALGRDVPPGVASSHTGFHEQLAPSVDEISARSGLYLRLLASPVDATVGLALRALTRAERAGRLDAGALIDHLAPAMTVRPQGHARRALTLVERAITQEPSRTSDALDVVLDALAHPAADVEGTALTLLERNAGALRPDQRDRLVELLPHLDPSVRTRAARIANPDGTRTATPAAPAVPVPEPRRLDPEEIPRLTDGATLQPVADVDELLDLAAVVLQRADDPDEIERFVDGVARLGAQPVTGARRAALLRRVDKQIADWWFDTTRLSAKTVVAVLAHCWLRQAPSAVAFSVAEGPSAALGRRLEPLSRRVAAGVARAPLSTPTHRGGFLDPVVLVARLQRAPDVDDVDLAQALLRIAPERRAEALACLVRTGDEATAVLAAALGDGTALRPAPPGLPASWDAVDALAAPASVAIEARRDPWSPRSREGPEVRPPCSPARLLGQYGGESDEHLDLGLQRWLASIWPAERDLSYGTTLRELDDLRLSAPVVRILGAALEPLLLPDEPFGPHAYGLVAAVLGRNGPERLLATDVVVEAIRTRRLVADELGAAIANAMCGRDAVAGRWARALAPLADYGPLHAYELQRILESTLAHLGDAMPARMTAIVDLVRRVVQEADARLVNRAARVWLEQLSPRSRPGRLAAAALAVTGDGGPRSIEAAAAAHEAERDRALRWAAARR